MPSDGRDVIGRMGALNGTSGFLEETPFDISLGCAVVDGNTAV